MLFILNNDDRKRAAFQYINMLSKSKLFSIEVKEYRKNRSKSQNRLYWSWVHILADHCGYEDDDEMHELLKVRLLGVREKLVDGIKLIQPVSTATLNTKQFSDYLMRIEQVANEMTVRLPIPDDYSYAMMNEAIPAALASTPSTLPPCKAAMDSKGTLS